MGIINSTQKSDQPTPTSATTKKQIFILSGQSNMAGRGGVHNKKWDKVVPNDCKPDPSIIHRLNANLIWETAQEPLHSDIDTKKTCGVGPGMSFANAVKDYINGVIDLVPCAVGGTAIKEWAKGEKLYEDMVRRVKCAVGSGGEVKAMLWYQGESDCVKGAAESYKANMERFIFDVAIASGEAKYIEVVREAQKAIDLPNVVCIDAMGLELKEDNLHLTTSAQVQLGHMLADAYLAHFG